METTDGTPINSENSLSLLPPTLSKQPIPLAMAARMTRPLQRRISICLGLLNSPSPTLPAQRSPTSSSLSSEIQRDDSFTSKSPTQGAREHHKVSKSKS